MIPISPQIVAKQNARRKPFTATIEGDIMNWVLVQRTDAIYSSRLCRIVVSGHRVISTRVFNSYVHSDVLILTARIEVRTVLFLAPSVCVFVCV